MKMQCILSLQILLVFLSATFLENCNGKSHHHHRKHHLTGDMNDIAGRGGNHANAEIDIEALKIAAAKAEAKFIVSNRTAEEAQNVAEAAQLGATAAAGTVDGERLETEAEELQLLADAAQTLADRDRLLADDAVETLHIAQMKLHSGSHHNNHGNQKQHAHHNHKQKHTGLVN